MLLCDIINQFIHDSISMIGRINAYCAAIWNTVFNRFSIALRNNIVYVICNIMHHLPAPEHHLLRVVAKKMYPGW